MPTTPINGARYPASSAAPNVPQDIQNLATDYDTKVIPRFASTAARDAAIPSPIRGMACWCDSPGYFYEYDGGWRPRVAGSLGALCKPVKLSNPSGGATKYAGPSGGGYFEMGKTPDLVIRANRIIRLDAPICWNSSTLATVGVRWERVRTDAAGFDLQTLEQNFTIGGSNLPDLAVNVHHQFTDQITTAGTYYWRVAAKTTAAGNTAGIVADAWAYLNATDVGPIPAV